MARITTDPNYSSPTFPRATAGTDLFVKEDVQALAAAVSTHDHSTGKGLPLTAGAIPNGTITSAMIADATIDTADLKDGSVTSAKIADGTIATADLANASVTNAKLAPDAVGHENLLTNGGLEIKQRSAASVATTTSFLIDGWALILGIGATGTFSQIASTIGSPGFSGQLVYTHAGTTGSIQSEKLENPQLRGKTLSMSAHVKSTVIGTVSIGIYDSVNNWRYSARNTLANTDQTLTLSVPIANNSTVEAVAIQCDVGSCTIEVNDAMLVVGSVAADYVALPVADDMARCQRYCRVFGGLATNEDVATGLCTATTGGQILIPINPPMAIAPALTISAAGDFAMLNNGGSPQTGTTITATRLSQRAALLTVAVASGLVAGNATSLVTLNTNARLTLEANP